LDSGEGGVLVVVVLVVVAGGVEKGAPRATWAKVRSR